MIDDLDMMSVCTIVEVRVQYLKAAEASNTLLRSF